MLLARFCDDVTSGPGVRMGDVDADWDEDVAGHGGTAWARADGVAGDVDHRQGVGGDVMVTGQ